ncbi:uncharacterized protein [Clytia hemisphaerica]|uniref:uncharacterized protein n=1 Tax=Clytia hemisphaerica TaxID=252671 RepID=UPI0034D6D553
MYSMSQSMNKLKCIALMFLMGREPRSVWAYEREERWFDELWNNRFNDDYLARWKADFRMSGSTFSKLVYLLRPALEKRDTNFRKAIPIQKRVAVALWRLANGNSFRTVSKTLAVGKSTAVKITNDFCRALIRFGPDFIHFPSNRRETAEAIMKFKEIEQCPIPQALGAIDGTHIQILTPATESKGDYFNRKQRYAVNTQAVIGSNLEFLSVATGYPGSLHDARVLRNTLIFRRCENGEYLTAPQDIVEQVVIRPLIIGDSAYPLSDWLIKPYRHAGNLTQSQRYFNRRLSGSRSIVERGFGLLKARWRCLLKRLDNEIENVSDVILSCFILHNICQISQEQYLDEDNFLDRLIQQERVAHRNRLRQNNEVNPLGDRIREVIREHIFNM